MASAWCFPCAYDSKAAEVSTHTLEALLSYQDSLQRTMQNESDGAADHLKTSFSTAIATSFLSWGLLQFCEVSMTEIGCDLLSEKSKKCTGVNAAKPLLALHARVHALQYHAHCSHDV